MNIRLLAIAAGAVSLLGASTMLYAQTAPTIWTGVYSDAQSKRGDDAYAAKCAVCHGNSLEGGDMAPPLTGSDFFGDFTGQTLADLVNKITTSMPSDNPGTTTPATATDIVAFILKSNMAPAGTAELPADLKVLGTLPIAPKSP